jgi:hypothetical protein
MRWGYEQLARPRAGLVELLLVRPERLPAVFGRPFLRDVVAGRPSGGAMTSIRDLLAEYGRAVALRVAVELGCGLSDKARIERCADDVLQELVAKQAQRGRDTLEREIDG